MLDCKQCYSKLLDILYFYCAFVIDTVYTKWDFMRKYFISILLCIYYVSFFNFVYLWFLYASILVRNDENEDYQSINVSQWQDTGTFRKLMWRGVLFYPA